MALNFPASPTNGQVFLSGGVSWVFDGEKWKVSTSSIEPVFISSSTPAGVAGQIYWDSDESTAYIYYDDGDTAQWVPLTSTAPVSFDTSAIVSGTLPVARGGTGTTSFDVGKIVEGDTEAEVVDTGSDGHFKVTTEGTERIRVGPAGQVGIAGANYGTSGQVLESGGPSAAISWATPVKLDAVQTFTAAQTFNAGASDSNGNFRSVPQNAQTSAYTLVAGDVGKHVSITTGGVTIPSGVFSAGDAISIYNNSGSDQTITQGASVTLRLAGDGTTGNKTLATYGLCTILCVASDEFVIAGTGLS